MVAKKIVQDIVPNERRSIRRITLDRDDEAPVRRPRKVTLERKVEEEEREEREEREEKEEERVKPPVKHKKNKNSFKYILTFGIIFISVIVICIALSLSYSKATVTITPKVVEFDIKGDFTAKKSSATSGAEDLVYEAITASDVMTEEVPATKGPLIQTKAKGVAIIYNNYSASPQTLVAGTRLSGSNGLIYRTASTVSVPGKKTTPGSISVNIIADQAGENYNLNVADLKGDFKLLGYKGTPKYDGFYGRLKTNITGGFSGNKMTVNEETKKATVTALQDSLKENLLAKLKSEVSDDHIFYDNAYNIEFTTSEPVMKSADMAEIKVSATAYGAIFKRDSLIKFIAGREIKKFPSDTYTINGDRELLFKISNVKDFSVKKGTSLIFTLSGPVSITGTFDEEKLKNELSGLKLQDSAKVFAKYSAITNAHTLITPFWLRTFPDSPNKINIEYKH